MKQCNASAKLHLNLAQINVILKLLCFLNNVVKNNT